MLRQPMLSTSQPPKVGPMMKAMPLQLAQTPNACARALRSGKASASSTSDIATSKAAPNPLTVRPTIKISALGASAQISVPATNRAIPRMKMRRRPNRSPSVPPVSSKLA